MRILDVNPAVEIPLIRVEVADVRTSVLLDSAVAAEIERLRRAGLGTSAALNMLARRGIAAPIDTRYRHRTARIGLKVDVSNVGDVLDSL